MAKRKKKKKIKYKYLLLVLLLVVIVGVVLTLALVNRKSGDEDYRQMQVASLPIVRVYYLDDAFSELHGYVTEMDCVSMRDGIVPLSPEKELFIEINPFQEKLNGMSYEIRSLDNEKYIDGGTPQLKKKDGKYNFTLTTSDLLESGVEYQLILEAELSEKTVYYYTRIIFAKTMHTDELLSFVYEFSNANYNREKAAEFIINYIQPEDQSDTTDYHYTDIHSKYTMFTFGNLEVEKGNDTLTEITELEPTQMTAILNYTIKMKLDDEWKTFYVEEFFCVRIRQEKVYLLDYHRTLEEKFDAENSTHEKGRIHLGISSGETQVVSTKNNDYTVFVRNRELFSYSGKNNAMNLIFSFNDINDLSSRSSYDHHNVQIVKVSEEGDIDYMVYGYMNRGSYEGQVGICFFRYSAKTNSTKRLFYMPVTQSEHLLMMDLGKLAYVNSDDVCYLRYGDGIYSIDLNSGETVEVTIRAYPGTYAKNRAGNVVSWQEGEDLKYPSRLVILNMDTQTTAVVNAPNGEYVKILDFIGDDIVYGFGNRENSVIEANMDTTQLLSKLVIASTSEGLTIQREYEGNKFFIVSASVYDTHMTIERAVKNRDGSINSIEEDVLLLTSAVDNELEKSQVKSKNIEPSKKNYFIQTSNAKSSDSEFSSVVPRFEVLKDANVLELQHHQNSGYYVYGQSRLMYVESDINKAIEEAYEVFGVVVDENMNYIWTRGTRDLVKTLSIQPYKSEKPAGTLATALQILCAEEGIQLEHVDEDLRNGKSPIDIINKAIGNGRALNLYGCSVSEVLYFINAGHPVMAITGDRDAFVIIGYDLNGISIYVPSSGETVTMDMNAAENYFKDYEYAFISYR